MEPPGHQRSVTPYDHKVVGRYFDFLPLKIVRGHSKTSKCVLLVARNTLDVEFRSRSIGNEVIGDHEFSSLFDT